MKLALHGAATARGLLIVALLTAAAASAQTADLAITLSASPNPVVAGSPFTATITVTNNGPSAATNVALVYLLPPNRFSTGGGTTPGGWTCVSGFNSYHCTIPTLAAGAFNHQHKLHAVE